MAATTEIVAPADVYNQTLVENVHPPAWHNPMPAGKYNLVVLGAGTAGLVSAAGAAALGARVALVERHLMGGDCLNFGCVPSKGVIRAARAAHAIREGSQFGVHAGEPRVDFAEAMERMRRVRAEISAHDSVHRFAALGVDVFLGSARFIAPDTVDVDGRRLKFSRAIIATGSRAAPLPVPGLAEAGYLTNETVFSLTALPRRLVVIGAGPIGCELAQAFRRLGSEVAIVSLDQRLLPREDDVAAGVLASQFQREGIRLELGVKVVRVERHAPAKVVVFDRDGVEGSVDGSEILVAVGRVPNVDGLELERAGVAYSQKGVTVNDQLRTSNRRIYAAGDIASAFKFTHAAEALARIALQNALFFGRRKASDLVIPWCTYTDPEIAHVGLYANEAERRGIDVGTFTLPLAEIDRALLDGDEEGFARAQVDRATGRLLGATLVSRHAGESIGQAVLAIKSRLRLSDLSSVIHPYPTQAEVWKRLGDLQYRSRLRPWMRRLLERYFAFIG